MRLSLVFDTRSNLVTGRELFLCRNSFLAKGLCCLYSLNYSPYHGGGAPDREKPWVTGCGVKLMSPVLQKIFKLFFMFFFQKTGCRQDQTRLVLYWVTTARSIPFVGQLLGPLWFYRVIFDWWEMRDCSVSYSVKAVFLSTGTRT